MRYSGGWTENPHRRGAETRLLALVAMFAVTMSGCEAATTNAPSVIAPIGPKPSADVIVSDGASVGRPCTATSRACGGFFPVIGAFSNAYLTQGAGDIGAYTRTWLPTGGALYLAAFGSATVYRSNSGVPPETHQLACSNSATECDDQFHTWSTCAHAHNEVSGATNHSAQGNGESWFGRFSDSRVCDPPPGDELSCDENGTPVDTGGDPANCPGDESGPGYTPPTGTQYQPGDYTNGHTVDFQTGIDDGGDSVCGMAAQVIDVCIDFWIEETQEWGNTTCGYATTC